MSLTVVSRSSGSSGPEAEDFVDDVAEDRVALAHAERHALFGNQVEEQRADVGFGARPLGRRQRFEVQPVEQLAVDVGLELDVLRPRRLDARPSARRRPWPAAY